MNVVRITVLKKSLNGDFAEKYAEREIHPCEAMQVGQQFITGFQKPDGFCDWAWNDISRPVMALLVGGSFRQGPFKGWMKDENTFISNCTDGLRPVSFLIERLDTNEMMDVSGAARPAPREVYGSERWGEFSYELTSLEAGRTYGLRLHFAEIAYNAAGKRLFSVTANGEKIVENLDIFAEADGAYKAIVREGLVKADGKGRILLDFIKGSVDYPKISAVELFDNPGATGKTLLAINTGGPAIGDYREDSFFSGGNTVGG